MKLLVASLILSLQLFAQTVQNDTLFVPELFTPKNSFTSGVEGPAVDKNGNIYAVNFHHQGTIGKITPKGRTTIFVELPAGSIGNGIRFNSKGEMFIADYTKHNILKVNMTTKQITVFAHNAKMNQPNDIAITDNNIIYASDPNWTANTGNLWMIDTSGNTHLLLSGMGTTNGVEVSPNNKTLYVNESTAHRILAFDIKSDGTLENKRIIKQYNDGSVLDGMRCDSTGNIYVACYDKGKIYILSSTGETLREITLHGKKSTNIAFGGSNGKTCYVTVAGNGNIEKFATDIPGRSWVMHNNFTGVTNKKKSNLPEGFGLKQNYPNPFNPATVIHYSVGKYAHVKIGVFDLLGSKIKVLENENKRAGNYSAVWNASNMKGEKVVAGVYIYRMIALPEGGSPVIVSKKMVLIK